MDLLDRYLAAIRRNLPAAKADDIVAELRDVLSSRIEDREESLGRALGKDEVSALLKEFGHPLVVASRYKQYQWLIGPEIYPFYLFALKIMLLITAAVMIGVSLIKAALSQTDLIQSFVQVSHDIWWTMLGNAALVTLVFVLFERAGWLSGHLAKWVPDQLPDVADKPKSATESIIEIGLGIAFLLWWTGVVPTPPIARGPGLAVQAAPIFTALYWPILILSAARLVQNIIEWLRPRWKSVRALFSLGTAVGGVLLIAAIYRAGHWVTIVSTSKPAEEIARIQESLNLSLRIAIIVVGVIWVGQCLGELWRLSRTRQG